MSVRSYLQEETAGGAGFMYGPHLKVLLLH